VHARPMRSQVAVVLAAVTLCLHGCDKTSSPPKQTQSDGAGAVAKPVPAVQLGDLSTSLAAVRTEFNAHKGEARFLTLLSPT
jgi:hypothetical protein